MNDYIIYFRKEIVIVENYTDAVAVTAIMAGLRPWRFNYRLAKNAPRTFTELLSRAQKYSSADELTNAKKGTNSDFQRSGKKIGKRKEK